MERREGGNGKRMEKGRVKVRDKRGKRWGKGGSKGREIILKAPRIPKCILPNSQVGEQSVIVVLNLSWMALAVFNAPSNPPLI